MLTCLMNHQCKSILVTEIFTCLVNRELHCPPKPDSNSDSDRVGVGAGIGIGKKYFSESESEQIRRIFRS